MMDIKKRVGDRIRELRTKQQFSQETLAHKANLDRTYINGVENGKRNISIVNLERIAAALGITLTEFFDSENFGQAHE